MRKKLPLLKLGDAVYEAPFVQFYNRASCLFIIFQGTGRTRELLMRYFRYINLQGFLTDTQIPLMFDIAQDIILVNGNRTPIVKLKMYFASRNAMNIYKFNSLIFLLPKAIDVLATLHRKAYFKYDDITRTAPSTQDESGLGIDSAPGE